MTTELRRAAAEALRYMKEVGQMNMHPHEWSIVGRLEAALSTKSTHSADCWKWHHECAIARIEEAEHSQTVIQRLLRERQIFMEAGQRDTETIDKLREENRTLTEAHFSQGLTICSLQEQLDEVEELREALKAELDEIERLQQGKKDIAEYVKEQYPTRESLKEVKHAVPNSQE